MQLSAHGFTAVDHPATLILRPNGAGILEGPATSKAAVVTEPLLLRSAVWSESDALATHASRGGNNTAGDQPKATGLPELEVGLPQSIGFDGSRRPGGGGCGHHQAEDALSAAGKSVRLSYADSGAPKMGTARSLDAPGDGEEGPTRIRGPQSIPRRGLRPRGDRGAVSAPAWRQRDPLRRELTSAVLRGLYMVLGALSRSPRKSGESVSSIATRRVGWHVPFEAYNCQGLSRRNRQNLWS
ncbi:hypothetical protein F4775DRAFT_591167 [Biscogniauxia sp. FL1348]|nr:hypothetical protein F4775DRAFT_591167 [Biscogniauxia sp. FL1348]